MSSIHPCTEYLSTQVPPPPPFATMPLLVWVLEFLFEFWFLNVTIGYEICYYVECSIVLVHVAILLCSSILIWYVVLKHHFITSISYSICILYNTLSYLLPWPSPRRLKNEAHFPPIPKTHLIIPTYPVLVLHCFQINIHSPILSNGCKLKTESSIEVKCIQSLHKALLPSVRS